MSIVTIFSQSQRMLIPIFRETHISKFDNRIILEQFPKELSEFRISVNALQYVKNLRLPRPWRQKRWTYGVHM